MQASPGLDLPYSDMVYKLQRSLYGLKRESRQWNIKFIETLLHSGYFQSKFDYSLFTKSNCAHFTMILVHVHNFVLG